MAYLVRRCSHFAVTDAYGGTRKKSLKGKLLAVAKKEENCSVQSRHRQYQFGQANTNTNITDRPEVFLIPIPILLMDLKSIPIPIPIPG